MDSRSGRRDGGLERNGPGVFEQVLEARAGAGADTADAPSNARGEKLMEWTSNDLIEDPVGRFPRATVACFDPTRGNLPRRGLDGARTVEFLRRLGRLGVPGVLIASSTGQGHLRTVDELEIWFRCVAAADVGEACREALLRPEDGEVANKRLLDLLARWEYPVVFFRPGTDLPPDATDEQVFERLRPLVAAAAERSFAIGLYSISDVSGLPLSPDVTARLVKAPGGERIVAAKVTEADYDSSTREYLAHEDLRHLKIVQGWDPHLARALQDGPRFDSCGRQRCGITSGTMSLAVHQFLHILSAADEEEWDEVARARHAVTALFAAMQDDPQKFADLQRAKYIMGLGHPLTATVEPEQVERVLRALEGLPRCEDRRRLARSLDLMGDGPFHERLARVA